MATRNHLGKSLFFSAALPAANTSAAFEALTWLELEYGQSYPQFGITHSNVDVPDLKSGRTKGVKDMAAGVDSQGACRIEDSALTTNQATFRDLCKSAGGNVALKIGTGSGTDNAMVTGDPVVYAEGYVHSYQQAQATGGASEGFTYNFKQNEDEIEATEPA